MNDYATAIQFADGSKNGTAVATHSETVCSLRSDALARRLNELVGNERQLGVEFLLHLGEFDRRRAFLEAGYDSLWSYCLRALHLREGPAARRIGAMRVLRRFPALEAPLRDGRLCMSTVTVLGPLFTHDNLDDLVTRAAFLTKSEVEHLVASLQPRVAPKEGIRKLRERDPAGVCRAASVDRELSGPSAGVETVDSGSASAPTTPGSDTASDLQSPAPPEPRMPDRSAFHRPELVTAADVSAPRVADARSRAEVEPVSSEQWSLRVTIDGAMKADLEVLASLLSHTNGGDLREVVREAIRCGIEKHGKRKGAVRPQRERRATPRPASSTTQGGAPAPKPDGKQTAHREGAPLQRTPIPARIRREVWERDGGCCTWTSPEGHRCGSRWKLEFDHIVPVALGGQSTASNLRIVCRGHNIAHAESIFGREQMARFAARSTCLGVRSSR